MKELCSKFLSLLRCVPYIVEENPKVQRFLSFLPAIYKERIEYDNPRTLEEAMRKDKICYDQNKSKMDHNANWKGKRANNYNQGKKGNRFNNKNVGNTYKGYSGTNFKNNQNTNQPEWKDKESVVFYNKEKSNQREPLKCWECGEPHYFKDCPNKKKGFGNVNSI